MGYSKDQLLTRLQELQIDHAKYEHPVVLTVEAQAKYVGNMGGALSKNLFLKDKKHRFYIVSAMADTKVDMKVLSQRLGLGKGGLRMAPEEALGEILQVPLGCVTPFALINESARGLDKFLKSIGRDSAYIDLEANPMVGKDQPPDLAAFVPSGSTVLPDTPEKVASSQVSTGNHVILDSKSVAAKVKKPSSNMQHVKENSAPAAQPSLLFKDPEKFVEEILDKTSSLLLSEITEANVKQQGEQLGTALVNSLRKRLSSDLKNLATIYKNTAYTEGFYAGTHHQPKRS
ncbi:prolyl-tRNA synthetase associated domain-containing protein 1 isoform X2 [Carica papaya]|uniref:prolyl-tRNA synthetase associated domain-containing protein 1 isoform X2 n=1 Tax=Carica papaya TaxID=3649 RepID=UPI000B8CAE4C|nr:prolyl-tRNA synthetase associated domain-containing protein 1 isoform X2 [Carica papaya]